MRADRLLSILLLLQTQRRLTTRQLAQRLEVSDRTIHRDMEALSAAGVPVVAERGASGGWSLLEPYQTNLTGLNDAEIQALFLTNPAHLLTDLGLRQAYEAALIKLRAAITSTQRHDADFIRQRIYVDTPGWQTYREDQPCFGALQTAVMEGRRAHLVYLRSDKQTVERLVDPLGLVAKGSQWYLVAGVGDDPPLDLRTYRVSRVQDVRLTEQPCRRPADFDLAAFWVQASAEFVANLPRYFATVLVKQSVLERFQTTWRFGRVQQVDPPDADGWCRAVIDFEVIEEATVYLLGLGPFARVLEPPELRARIKTFAERTVALYAEES